MAGAVEHPVAVRVFQSIESVFIHILCTFLATFLYYTGYVALDIRIVVNIVEGNA